MEVFEYVLERRKSNGRTESISELWFRRSGFPISYRDLMLDMAKDEPSLSDKHRFMSVEFLLSRFGKKVKRAAEQDKCAAYILRIFSCWVAEVIKAKLSHQNLLENLHMNTITDPRTIDAYYRAVADVLRALIVETPSTLAELQDSILAKYILDNGLVMNQKEIADRLGLKQSQFYAVRKAFLERVRGMAIQAIGGGL